MQHRNQSTRLLLRISRRNTGEQVMLSLTHLTTLAAPTAAPLPMTPRKLQTDIGHRQESGGKIGRNYQVSIKQYGGVLGLC